MTSGLVERLRSCLLATIAGGAALAASTGALSDEQSVPGIAKDAPVRLVVAMVASDGIATPELPIRELGEYDQEILYRVAGFEIGSSTGSHEDRVVAMRGVIETIIARTELSCFRAPTLADAALSRSQFNVIGIPGAFSDLLAGYVQEGFDPVLIHKGAAAASAAREALEDYLRGEPSPFSSPPTNFDANGSLGGTYSCGSALVPVRAAGFSTHPTTFYAPLASVE